MLRTVTCNRASSASKSTITSVLGSAAERAIAESCLRPRRRLGGIGEMPFVAGLRWGCRGSIGGLQRGPAAQLAFRLSLLGLARREVAPQPRREPVEPREQHAFGDVRLVELVAHFPLQLGGQHD